MLIHPKFKRSPPSRKIEEEREHYIVGIIPFAHSTCLGIDVYYVFFKKVFKLHVFKESR